MQLSLPLKRRGAQRQAERGSTGSGSTAVTVRRGGQEVPPHIIYRKALLERPAPTLLILPAAASPRTAG